MRIEEADGATLHSFGAVHVSPPAAFAAVGQLIPEQFAQQRIVEARIQAGAGHAALGVDAHHRWRHLLHRGAHKAAAGAQAIGPGRWGQPQREQRQQHQQQHKRQGENAAHTGPGNGVQG